MSAKGKARTKLLLNVTSYLMHAKDGVPLRELADEFGTSLEEMRKIVNHELNFADVVPGASHTICAFFGDDDDSDTAVVEMLRYDGMRTPVRLLEDEALALRFMVSAFDAPSKPWLSDTLASLKERLAAAIGSTNPDAASFASARTSVDIDQIVDELQDAISECIAVDIDYYSAEGRERFTRRVQPHIVFQEAGRFYMRGFCEIRQALRSFRVDRIASIQQTEETFTPPRNANQVPRAVPGWDGTTSKETFTVKIEPVIAEEVAQQWEEHAVHMRWNRDGSLDLKLPLYSRSWVIGWVLSFGPNAELLSPERLREGLVERIEEMLSDLST